MKRKIGFLIAIIISLSLFNQVKAQDKEITLPMPVFDSMVNELVVKDFWEVQLKTQDKLLFHYQHKDSVCQVTKDNLNQIIQEKDIQATVDQKTIRNLKQDAIEDKRTARRNGFRSFFKGFGIGAATTAALIIISNATN